jgi:hypothetical protein
LSSGLYESLDPKQQVWFLDWKRKWKETGELSEAAKVPAPSDEAVERHKKRRASAARLDKGGKTGGNPQTKKQKQKHRKTNTKGAEGQSYPPSSSSTRPGTLSIQKLAPGDGVVPDCAKNLPTLRVIMFKEPKGVSIPFSSSSKTHRPVGMLAINANRTKNPREEDIDLNSRDYSYVDPPRTKLSTVSSRQVSISRLVKLRKLVVESAPSVPCGAIPHVFDITTFARDNAHEWESQASRPASTPTLSLRVRRAHSPVRARPTRSILDTGCDWSVVALGWKVLREHDELFCCQGAFAEGDEVHCRLVDAITVFTFPPSSSQPPILVRANRVLYLDDPAQFESLLDPVQLWANGIMIDLCATQFPAMNGGQGKQGMQVDGSFYPFDFDGQQLYFHHRLPSQHELDNLPNVILTSGDPSVYPLPASRKSNVFRRSGHTVLVTRRRRLPKEELTKWRGRLCYVPDAVILKTLAATTQLIESVEVDNRLVPRKHLVSRLLPLRHRRLRESFATDWFHVTTRSARSFRGFQLYVGQKSKTLFPYCLRRKLHMVYSLLELCRDVGIPERLMMDGDGAQNNPEVTRVVNDYIIKVHNSEPENQQQNWAERGGATVKQGIRRLHFETKFEIAYWCYAVQHFCDCFNHTACRELGWQCRLEALHGPTQDISVFRFVFWDHVWFWDPHIRFPASLWRLGRFLGRAKNVGDPFTFWVKPVRQDTDVREPRVLSRSVVRECVDVNEGPLDKNDCVDLPVADLLFPSVPSPLEPLETIMEEPDEDEDANEIGINESDAYRLVDAAESKAVADMILPETVELEDCVDGLADDPITPEDVFFDSEEMFPTAGGDNDSQLPVVSQDDFADDALQFDDPVDTSEAANVVNNTFGYLRDADGSPCDFVEILSHRGDSVSSLELEVRWTNGTNTWASFADVKEDQPALAAKYILANTISCDTSGSLARWARVALRTLKRSIRRIRRAYRFATTPDTALSLESWRSLPFRARIRKSTNSPAASPSSKQSTKSKKKKAGRNNRHLGEVKYGVSSSERA